MYNKTTSSNYLRFGKISDSFRNHPALRRETITTTDNYVAELTAYSNNVYIELTSGMALIRLARDPQLDSVQTFAIHRNIRVNKGNYLAVVPMTGSITYNLYYAPGTTTRAVRLEPSYPYKRIVPSLHVHEIIAYYYVVKGPHYVFPGEIHQFYELTYVDHGSLRSSVNKQDLEVGANCCLVYGPGQFHDQKVVSSESCSYLTVIFDAQGLDESVLLGRVFKCSRSMLQIIEEFVRASDLAINYQYDSMIAKLTSFLIALLQQDSRADLSKPTTPIYQHFENRLLEEIDTYINSHLYEPLPIDQICREFSISRSSLQNLFNANLQIAPKQYINEAKLSRSRMLIRKGEHTISEVSSMLGFTSIHYFSRKFTQRYGVTPSEFAKKIYDPDSSDNI